MKPMYECTVCHRLFTDELGTQDKGLCNGDHSIDQTMAIICVSCQKEMDNNESSN